MVQPAWPLLSVHIPGHLHLRDGPISQQVVQGGSEVHQLTGPGMEAKVVLLDKAELDFVS